MKKCIFLSLVIGISISSCKKEETPVEHKKPKTLSEAGITKEIDIYEPGTYWVYNWTEFDYYGGRINSGIDTIKVVDATQCDSCRQVIGTVHGEVYTATYLIKETGVTYQTVPYQLYYLQGGTIILFDSTDVKVDYPLNSADRGCGSFLTYLHERNIPTATVAGNFISILTTQNTSRSPQGCRGGFETINSVRGDGEIYRVTSYEREQHQGPIRFTRELIAYNIAY